VRLRYLLVVPESPSAAEEIRSKRTWRRRRGGGGGGLSGAAAATNGGRRSKDDSNGLGNTLGLLRGHRHVLLLIRRKKHTSYASALDLEKLRGSARIVEKTQAIVARIRGKVTELEFADVTDPHLVQSISCCIQSACNRRNKKHPIVYVIVSQFGGPPGR
jgi:hypothetical protein